MSQSQTRSIFLCPQEADQSPLFWRAKRTVRSVGAALALGGLLSLSSLVAAQTMPAIPVTVRDLVQSPPAKGRLVKVSGYLGVKDGAVTLQDTHDSRKIVLNVSGASSATQEALETSAASQLPVLIIGRVTSAKDSGKPMVTVLGAMNLTR